MRIIAGNFRGRRIFAPVGDATRPTSDRVRESLFALIESRIELTGARVLDLYAGSGALGLEALSRGAAHATFVEKSAKAVSLIKKNIEALMVTPCCHVMPVSVDAAIKSVIAANPFDLVVADPPYADDVVAIVQQVLKSNLLGDSGLFVLEHQRKKQTPELVEQWTRQPVRNYGDTALSMYMRNTEKDD